MSDERTAEYVARHLNKQLNFNAPLFGVTALPLVGREYDVQPPNFRNLLACAIQNMLDEGVITAPGTIAQQHWEPPAGAESGPTIEHGPSRELDY